MIRPFRVFKPFHDTMMRYADAKSHELADRYLDEQGPDADLEVAERVRVETKRRAVMGYMLDLLEPAVWQTIAVAAAAGLAIVQKVTTNRQSGKETEAADVLLPMAFAALGSSVNYARLWMRYQAGLEGGYDVATNVQPYQQGKTYDCHIECTHGVLSFPQKSI